MRTTLELDDGVMDALMCKHPHMSKTEAIQTAVRASLMRDAISTLRSLGRQLEIDDLSAHRRNDRNERSARYVRLDRSLSPRASGRAAALDGLLARNDVVVCGPVVAELLAARSPSIATSCG